ncbi:DUF2252 domain-containing protein [Ideonella sp.]|uniref:DUF2252 domain-containing protein n=1 Tax=Ideonella sp. TaxID=1929293 RepID=UPI003BB5D1DD
MGSKSAFAQALAQSHGRPHPDRQREGKALREHCPRSRHGAWTLRDDRADPIDLLQANSEGREAALLPLRYGRMLASPFTFFRGAAAIMAHDLAATPDTRLPVVACGDAHLLNFGGFATPERRLVFDINDFDEVSAAPWEWDVKRLAASFAIAAQAYGCNDTEAREAAWWAARSYRLNMARYATLPVLQAYYEQIDLAKLVESGTDAELKKLHRKRLKKAQCDQAHVAEFAKLAVDASETPRIRDSPPLIFHDRDIQTNRHQRAEAEAMLARYRLSLAPERRVLLDRYRLADVALKVVGVGSVGTYCGIALMVSGGGDPLFLQFKEARASVLEAYAGRAPFAQHGQRVVFGQRLTQAASDVFLGWMKGTKDLAGRHFYVRQLRDAKVKVPVELMNPANLCNYAKACGWALARAHKRSGDAVRLSGYMGLADGSAAFDDAVAEFALRYAVQNERDHAALKAAVRSGRIEASSDLV